MLALYSRHDEHLLTLLKRTLHPRIPIQSQGSNDRHSKITSERVSRVFGIGLNSEKHTKYATAQGGKRHTFPTFKRTYNVDHINLHRQWLSSHWYLDR
eukprot:CCRYP_004992-RA/>CCRYP_004992-RA protein AED:0.51 eAED:0.48 QI:0/0/0/1/0/0/2/0/97